MGNSRTSNASGTENADLKAAPSQMQGNAAIRFSAPRVEPGRIVLECQSGGNLGSVLRAFVDGIPIGSSAPLARITPGQTVALAIECFPCLALPCSVRFSDESGAIDLSPPLVLKSASAVERLVGPGKIEEVKIALRGGAISGTGINRINGVGRPMLVGRINGTELREVQFESVRPREQGGSHIAFTMRRDVADLTETGATYEILALPELAVLGQIAFDREDAGVLKGAVTRVDTTVNNLSKRVDFELARAAELAERRHQEQRRLLEGVVEYLVALVYDRVAVAEQMTGPVEAASKVAADEAISGFHQMLAQLSQGKTIADRLDYCAVRPDMAYFANGWSWLEQDSKGFDFRWMGLGGVVYNPHPNRPVSQVTVTIGLSYGKQDPIITAMLDATKVDVEIVPSPDGPPYTLRILPPSPGHAIPAQVLRLTSAIGGRPSEDGGTDDERFLSIAVTGITFHYGA